MVSKWTCFQTFYHLVLTAFSVFTTRKEGGREDFQLGSKWMCSHIVHTQVLVCSLPAPLAKRKGGRTVY